MSLGPPPVKGPDRRARTPIDMLSRRHDHVCTTAIDAWQIAAVLESDGITDRVAHERYGFADVFELADALYRRVPLRLTPDDGVEPPETGRASWESARGLLFLVAGLMYPAAFAFGVPWPITLGLVAGLVVGWAASNGVSYLAFRRAGSGREAASKAVYRQAIVGAVAALALAVAAVTWGLAVPLSFVLPGALLVAFQLSASALLFTASEPALAVAMAPGVIVNVLYLVTRGGLVGPSAAAAATALSVLLTLSAALASLGRRAATRDVDDSFTSRDLLGAVATSSLGGLTAILLTVDTLTLVHRAQLELANAFGASVLPLVLTTGVMEPLLRRQRNEMHALLAASHTRRSFAKSAWRCFSRSLSQYVLLIAAVSAAALPGILYALHGERQVVLLLAAQLVLGVAIFVSFAIVSGGGVVAVLAAAATAVGLHLADVAGWLPGVPPHGPAAGYLMACMLYLILLIPILAATLPRPEAHR